MGAQDVILGARVAHLRELKAEVAALKAENSALRDENAELRAHFAEALLAAGDLKALASGGRLVVVDGWNAILGAEKEARSPAELVSQAKRHVEERPQDMVWIVFDGPRENSRVEGRVRVTYTGGAGAQRADRMICDFLRAARLSGDASRIEVRTHDKALAREAAKISGHMPGRRRRG